MAHRREDHARRSARQCSGRAKWVPRLLAGVVLVLFAFSAHGLAGPPTSAPGGGYAKAEGFLARAPISICMAGETHVLLDRGPFLLSSCCPALLDAYVGRYVHVWGYERPGPECLSIDVVGVEPIDVRSHYLPIIVRGRPK